MNTSSILSSWLIPLCPFVGFVLIAMVTYRRRRLSAGIALFCIGLSFVLAQTVLSASIHSHSEIMTQAFSWFSLGKLQVSISVYVDPLAAAMLSMVTILCLLIFVYSIGYMHDDPKFSRFMAYVSLFASAMLGLIVFDNLLALFVFWEIMGTCSYLLIGFWFERPAAYRAGLKAFLTTKVGDLFLLLGILLIYNATGTMSYRALFEEQTLEALSAPVWGSVSIATVASLLLFGGTVGKSAQFPLHVWLPDAMEGPTPASSLIHAATMVSAGVFMVIRMFPILQVSDSLQIVASVGAFTALFAATIAFTQSDIKRVLAFSTISQLGYMVTAVGIGAQHAAFFHLLTHAFFKALLFMAAGSVIHGMEHGHLHSRGHAIPTQDIEHFNANDMLGMGGLARKMPFTAIGFIAGALSLSGFPLVTAGFWSKDEILSSAWHSEQVVFWVLAITAGITAFYTARQVILTFLGAPRSGAATHAVESTSWMTVPLVVLAVFALCLGWLAIPSDFPVLGRVIPNLLHAYISVGAESIHAQPSASEEGFAWQPLLISVSVVVVGYVLAWLVYRKQDRNYGAVDRMQYMMKSVKLGWLYNVIERRYYIDRLYIATLIPATLGLSQLCDWIDRNVIDPLFVSARTVIKGAAKAANWTENQVVDQTAKVVSKPGLAQIADAFDHYLLASPIDFAGKLGRFVSRFFDATDKVVVDGVVDGVAAGTHKLGERIRKLQTGVITDYIWSAFVMALFILGIIVLFKYL